MRRSVLWAGKRSGRWVAGLFAAALVMVLLVQPGCKNPSPSGPTTESSKSETPAQPAATQGASEVAKEGSPAPDFALQEFGSDKTVRLSDYRGKKAVLLNFFATWCGPCHQETPHLVALKHKYEDQPVEIVAVCLDADNTKAVGDFIAQYKIKHPVLKGTEEVANTYGVKGIPANVVIDKQGVVKHILVGYRDLATFEAELLPLM